MEPDRTRFCDLSCEARLRAYAEIGLVSSASFIYAAAMTAIASWIWTKWADQAFHWQFGLVVGIIGLVPYLVIAAAVWRVNLSIFGNRVSSERVPSAGAIAQGTRGSLEDR